MNKPVRQSAPSSKSAKAESVADYIVNRLAAEGIEHCFGVAGDYVFPVCDAVDSSAKVKWIGCANELNASYAADGYARVRGAAMLTTTYGVGELSAINGVMGAKAERSLVFHVVGMPSYQHQRVHKIAHHTLGDGVFGNFVALSAGAACCHAVINPENCVVEMERVIAEARRNNQPAYIAVPSDYALSPVVPADVKPIVPRSNEAALQKAMAMIAERINKAKVRRRVSGLHNFAARLAERGTEGDRRAGLSFCHNAHGKMRDRRGSSAVCRHVCRRGVGSENAANRRRRRSRARSGRRQFERHHHGGLFRPPRSVPVYYRRPRRRQDRRRSHRQCPACGRSVGAGQAQTIIDAIPGKTAGACAGKRQAIRQDHDGGALSALRGIPARRGHGRPRDREFEPRRHANDPPRRRAGGSAGAMGVDRLGDPGRLRCRACRSRAGAQF